MQTIHMKCQALFFSEKTNKKKTYLRGTDTLSGKSTLSKLFYLPSEKGFTLKGKNLFPAAANSFLFRVILFQTGHILLKG